MTHQKPCISFRFVAEDYVRHGGEGRYLDRVIAHFEDRPIAEIYPFDIRQMANELYPDQQPATRNRCALTPARAVIMHGYDRGWCNLIRIRSFKVERPRKKHPASQMWLHMFMRQCDRDGLPHLAAIVLFMSHTGARVSEATSLRWAEVDLPARKAVLLRTKTGRNSERFLTDELVARLYSLLDGTHPDRPVFRYTTRWSVNDRIAAVCRRAGISYKSSHACGRHSFATNAIAMGMDVASAMEAGDWRSPQLFLQTYVHTRNAGRRVAECFNDYSFDRDV